MPIYLALCGITDKAQASPSKLIHTILDPTAAVESMMEADPEHVWIVEGYLVYFDIGQPWYSKHKILSELLIVRVETGGTFAGVALFLREKARAAGAAFAVAGTALARNDAALARLYRSGGFSPAAITLTAEA